MLFLIKKQSGVTLVELIVVLGIFLILTAIMYPTFGLIKNQIDYINDMQVLNNKAQKIIDYMADDIMMTGFIIGPEARIPFCQTAVPALPNTVSHTDGNPYDTYTFLTAVPVILDDNPTCMNAQKNCAGNPRIDYALTTRCDTGTGGNTINVDSPISCIGSQIQPASGSTNARSFITFETLAPISAAILGEAPQVYYTVTNLTGYTITISESLSQTIPDNSTIYSIRRYGYGVDTNRNLIRDEWISDCSVYATTLIETNNLNPNAGGIDGLQFEYIFEGPISSFPTSVTCINLEPGSNLIVCSGLPQNTGDWSLIPLRQLRAIRVWLLLRSDTPDKNHTDTATYTIGQASPITVGPFNDHYRRILVNKTVEVKNLAAR